MVETKEDLIAELKQKNIKHTPDEIIWIGRDPESNVVWLETGVKTVACPIFGWSMVRILLSVVFKSSK